MFDGKSGSPSDSGDRDVYSPGRLNREARSLLEGKFKKLWLEGEISNLSRPASGHLYFGLKDDRAQVRCAFFRSNAARMKFRPKDGDQVLIQARVSLYEARGEFQLIVQSMEPAGAGQLQAAFEALKRKLASEGLFEPELKKTLPAFPTRIAIVTSPSGAAVRDVVSVISRRAPFVELMIIPTPVQGDEAPAALKRALQRADELGFDVILLTRGGGSLEDLWAFNDENLARAIVACHTPVACAVGHEIDFTIADFVADLRAPTPSAAAEILVPEAAQLRSQIDTLHHRLNLNVERLLQALSQRVDNLERRLMGRHPGTVIQLQRDRASQALKTLKTQLNLLTQTQDQRLAGIHTRFQLQQPQKHLDTCRQKLSGLQPRLPLAMDRFLQVRRDQLTGAGRNLHLVSPLATLDRGFSVTFGANGQIVRSVKNVSTGDVIRSRLPDGEIESSVSKAVSKKSDA